MYGRMGSGGGAGLSIPGVRVIVAFLLAQIGLYPVVYHGLVTGTSSANAAPNTAALEALWATVGATGSGVIYFSPGTWSLEDTDLNHQVGGSVTISLQGSGGTTILLFHGTTGPFLDIGATTNDAINYGFIRDMQFRHADTVTSGATLQLGWVGNYEISGIRSIFADPSQASMIAVTLTAGASALKFIECKFSCRSDITQLSFDGLSPIGLNVAQTTGAIGGLEFHGTEFSGCLGGGATVVGDAVTAVTVSSCGSGYSSAPTVSFTGGGGSGAAGTAVLSGGKVVSVTITNGGSGYTGIPAVSFSGGGGTGAAAVIDGRGTGIRWANTAGIDTVTFSGLSLVKDWETGMRFGFGSGTGTIANLIVNGLTIDGISNATIHYSPVSVTIINHQYTGCWFSGNNYQFLLDNTGGGGTLRGLQIVGSYLSGGGTRSLIASGTISELVIVGNRITCDAATSSKVALELGDGTNAVTDMVICGNRIGVSHASVDAVIRVNANCDGYAITGNMLSSGATDIINTPGTDTKRVVANNAWLA